VFAGERVIRAPVRSPRANSYADARRAAYLAAAASVPEAAPLNTELEDQHPSAAGQLPELQDSDSGYYDVLVPGH